MTTRFLLCSIIFTLFFPVNISTKPVDNNKLPSVSSESIECECVQYFLNKLNNGIPVEGEGAGPTAASMANDQYWQKTIIRRTHSQTAQAGDIVIMQPNAVVYPWNTDDNWWDFYFENNPIG